jgi:hypothetical protein
MMAANPPPLHWAAISICALLCTLAGCDRKKDAPAPGAGPGITVSAEVIRKSRLPDPKRSDYPDCDFSCEMLVREIYSDERTPRRIVVMLPGFRNRELQWCDSVPVGGMLDLTLVPSGIAPQQMKTRQRADHLDNYDLPVYFASEVRSTDRLAASFDPRPDSYFAGEMASAAPATPTKSPAPYPWSQKAARERQAAIQKDKDTILSALKANGGSWDAWLERISPFVIDIHNKAKAAGGALKKDGAYFERLRWKRYLAVTKQADEGKPGPVKMLDHLNQELRSRGIDLIVVPFPYKEEVHADLFSSLAPTDGWFEPLREKFILQLLERDIEVIELIPPLREARKKYPFVFYDAHDNHPAHGAIITTAEQIAQRLERYDLDARRKSPPLSFQTRDMEWVCAPGTPGGFIPGSRYPHVQVLDAQGLPIVTNQGLDSAVVLMGDSYTITPHPSVASAALPMHLARLIGEVPNQLSAMGSSDAAMKMMAREGARFFAHRCAVIFAFAPTKIVHEASDDPLENTGLWNLVNLPPITFSEGEKSTIKQRD